MVKFHFFNSETKGAWTSEGEANSETKGAWTSEG